MTFINRDELRKKSFLTKTEWYYYSGLPKSKAYVLFDAVGFPKVIIDGVEYAVAAKIDDFIVQNIGNAFYGKAA